jgi:hypothetical protein
MIQQPVGEFGLVPACLPDRSENVPEAVSSLQVDEFSEVIETPNGFHIIQVLEKETKGPPIPTGLAVSAKTWPWRSG